MNLQSARNSRILLVLNSGNVALVMMSSRVCHWPSFIRSTTSSISCSGSDSFEKPADLLHLKIKGL